MGLNGMLIAWATFGRARSNCMDGSCSTRRGSTKAGEADRGRSVARTVIDSSLCVRPNACSTLVILLSNKVYAGVTINSTHDTLELYRYPSSKNDSSSYFVTSVNNVFSALLVSVHT